MKRLLSIILAVCMLTFSMVPAFAEDSTEKDYALLDLGGSSVNIKEFKITGGTTVKKEGKQAVYIDSKNTNPFIVVNIANDFLYNLEGRQPVTITVEYYDEGNGSFTLAYDGLNNIMYDIMQTEAEIVHLENTKTWKTHVFYADDMKIADTYLGADFRIGLWSNTMGKSSASVSFGSVKIEKSYAKDPIKAEVSSNYYGNIIGPNDEKKLIVDMENIADVQVNAKVNYTISDDNGSKIEEGSLEEVFEPNQKLSKELEFSKVDKFGTYTVDLQLETEQIYAGEKKTNVSEKELDFSYVNKPERQNDKQHIATHGTRGDINASAELAKYAGFGGVRDEISWNSVETSKGTFGIPQKSGEYVNIVKNGNMDYLLVLDYGNLLYDTDKAFPGNLMVAPYTDAGIAAYARYCAYMAEKYKGIIKYYEIWNEYNILNFNKRGEDGAMYAKMLKAAYSAIKEVNHDAVIVGMDTAGADTDFMREVLEAGGYDYMDIVSYHPYDWSGKFRLPNFVKSVRAVEELFEEYGGKKPAWFSELGMSSASTTTGVGEEMQAAYAVQIYVTSQGEQLCERTYWYDLINDGNNVGNQEHCFGIVRSQSDPRGSYVAKPVMLAFAGMNSFLGDAEVIDSIKIDENVYAYRFKKANGEQVIAAWAVNGKQNFALNLGCSQMEIFDINTNSMGIMNSSDGIYDICLSSKPIYIKGNFADFKAAETKIEQSEISVKTVLGDSLEIVFTDKENRNLTIEAEENDIVKIVSNNGIKNGKGSIVFKTEQEKNDFDIDIKIKDGEKIVSVKQVGVEMVDQMGVSIVGTSKISVDDPNHWQVKVNVKNYSKEKSFSGACNLKMDGNTENLLPAKFFNLRPGKDVTVYLNMPTIVKKRIKDIAVEVKTDTGLYGTAEAKVDFSAASYTEKTPVIDGNLDKGEWIGTWVTADELRNVKQMTWDGASDCSFDGMMMWDETNFYVAALVTDDVFYNNETPDMLWNGDSLQFALKHYDGVVIVDGNKVDDDFSEIGVALLPTGPAAYRFRSMSNKKPVGIIENADVNITRTGNKTIYEFAIPWSEIFYEGYTPKENTELGFSLLVNDNDGNGRGWLEYKEGIGASKNALLFGRMNLLK